MRRSMEDIIKHADELERGMTESQPADDAVTYHREMDELMQAMLDRRDAELRVTAAVHRVRGKGARLEDIGNVIGISRQAVKSKYFASERVTATASRANGSSGAKVPRQ